MAQPQTGTNPSKQKPSDKKFQSGNVGSQGQSDPAKKKGPEQPQKFTPQRDDELEETEFDEADDSDEDFETTRMSSTEDLETDDEDESVDEAGGTRRKSADDRGVDKGRTPSSSR